MKSFIKDVISRLRYVRDSTEHQDKLVPDPTNEMCKWPMECKILDLLINYGVVITHNYDQ